MLQNVLFTKCYGLHSKKQWNNKKLRCTCPFETRVIRNSLSNPYNVKQILEMLNFETLYGCRSKAVRVTIRQTLLRARILKYFAISIASQKLRYFLKPEQNRVNQRMMGKYAPWVRIHLPFSRT